MTIELLKTPPYAPGFHVAEALRDGLRVAKVGSVTYGATSPKTTTVCRVPANTLILGVMIEVTTGWTTTAGSVGGTLGDSDTAAALYTLSSDVLLTTGFKANFGGKNYTAAQDILFTETNTTSDTLTGAGTFWLFYRTESDKSLIHNLST